MQIEDLSIEVRPRTGWQALDLGIKLAQRWYLPLLVCFALPLLAVATVCALLIPDSPNLAVFFVWWFKPLYERVPLSFLSTAIFGDVPTIREAFSRWRSCVLPGLLPALTYLRLSPTRSFKAPILVLEGLTGEAKKKRFQVLNESQNSEGTWLTILCVHIEAFLNIGLVVTVAMFLPPDAIGSVWESYLEGLSGWQAWANSALYFACVILIGPIYVAAGFALYLNRRVELEAWDIELGFRKLVHRLSQAAVLFVAVCFIQIQTTTAHADVSGTAEESKTEITQILAAEDYHQRETSSYPKFLDYLDWTPEEDEPDDWSWLNLAWLATFVEIGLWILGIAIVLWIVYRLGLLEKLWSTPREAQPIPPEKLFGMALDSKTLPDDILQAAGDRWQAGEQRAALSLMLRGWLLRMIQRYGCRFREGDTEADCLKVVKNQTELSAHDRFSRLINAWLRSAYAHQPTTEEVFDQLQKDWTAQWTTPVD